MYDPDNEPTVEELSEAITAIAPWKALGSHGIPADLLQYCKSWLLSNVGEKVWCHKKCVMLRS